ncbi:MAG: 50S ribosomal protein L2 [Phycisphaerales bacterium]
MPIRIYDKTSAGRRFSSVNLNTEVTKFEPEKSLTRPLPKTGGRNHHGKITSRGRGGGAQRLYRVIDFRRADRDGIEGTVVAIEYDPNRTAHIALVEYADKVKRYILAPVGLSVGAKIIATSRTAADPKVGNSMPLKYIPTGLSVHCVELRPNGGGQMCRSAGMYARLTNREGNYATLVLPSGEVRMVHVECRATIGEVGNADQQNVRWGKAGRMRHLGRRPITRGVAKSHNAHPLGGGSGRSKGNRPPCSPTGVLAKGGDTRNKKKHSTKMILRRRVSTRYGQKTK